MAKRDWAIWDYAWYLAENIIFLKLDSLIPSVISLVFKTILSLFFSPQNILPFEPCLVHVMIISHQGYWNCHFLYFL